MIEIHLNDECLVVRANSEDFRPRHESQLVYWGFQRDPESGSYSVAGLDAIHLAQKVVKFFEDSNLRFRIDNNIQDLLAQRESMRLSLCTARDKCSRFKSGISDRSVRDSFESFVSNTIARPLKAHQMKAALHLLYARNGANFSVGGSGKTSVVLAVYHYLRQRGEIDSLFVVGPPSCFGPWRVEYASVLGTRPTYEVMAGGDVDDRRSIYLVDSESVCDLYLTTFQTLERDWQHVRRLFHQRRIRFFLVVDEAHYIKQPGGAWANAVLEVSRHAVRRCVLTGTPFPRDYTDAFNLFEALWPDNSPIEVGLRHRIEIYSQRKEYGKAAAILDEAIGPLYYRVRKSDLQLAPQNFHKPLQIVMKKYERLIYDSILDRIQYASATDYCRDLELLARLRRGRMIRLRQCVSYSALLESAVAEYDERLLNDDGSLSKIIRNYDELEIPAKLEVLLDLVATHSAKNEKVVVWSNFVGTLQLIRSHLSASGHGVRLIYGATPVETRNLHDELTREAIIAEFVDPESSISILVANPAACAESISLHKSCSHAVYYDLSYNCAQYLQSLDRIHRVGGSEHKIAHYEFLQYEDSIDDDIMRNVQRKAHNMSVVIDQEYPIYSLDMYADDTEDVEAYIRMFGHNERPV